VPEAPAAPEAPPAPPDAPGGPPEPPSGPISSGPSKPGPRGGLLADINKGEFKLKKVGDGEEKTDSRPKSASAAIPPDKVGSIMGALTQAMGERFKAVQADDDAGGDEVDDWSD